MLYDVAKWRDSLDKRDIVIKNQKELIAELTEALEEAREYITNKKEIGAQKILSALEKAKGEA